VKRIFILLLFFNYIFIVFSEETSFQNKDILAKFNYISTEIKSKNPGFIDEIYNYNQSDPDYKSLIDFLVEKAGDLVFQKEYDYAFKIIEAVLYNNLDNTQAQELYLTLGEIKKKNANKEKLRLEKEAEQERQKQQNEEALRLEALAEAEKLKQAQAEEKQRVAEKKALEDNFQKNLDEKQRQLDEADAYETSIKTVGLKNFSYYTFLYPGDFFYYTSEVNTLFNTGQKKENILYGLALQGGINFNHPLFNINLDMDFDYGFLGINASNSKNLNYNATFSIGSPVLFIPLTLRLGFLYNKYLYENNLTADMAIVSMPTALVGIGLWDIIFFNRVKIDLAFDYYLVSFLTTELDSSYGAEFSVSVRLFSFRKLNIYTGISTHALFLEEAGMFESNINGKIGIGISYNE